MKPSALQQIPADVFKEFSIEQIFELSPEQAAATTAAQRDALSPEQKATLLTVETDTGEYSSSGIYSQPNVFNQRIINCMVTGMVALKSWL